MARQRIINYHTSGTTAPSADNIYYGELVVSHNSIGNTKIYTKVTNPSGDTNEGKIATFIDEPQIDEKISNSVNGLTDIVQNLANLTITEIKAEAPISATTPTPIVLHHVEILLLLVTLLIKQNNLDLKS